MAAIVRASHPISFQLLNRDRQPILAIFDGLQGQTLKLAITNSSRRNVKPKQLTGPPTADNHHFEVRFRPGTLILPDSVTPNRPAIAVEEADWKISDKPVVTDGGVSFYLIANPAVIESGKSTSVTLKNLSGDGKVGAHGTRVELKWTKNLEYVASTAGESPEPLAPGHRQQHLSVINESGQQHIPLHVGIVGNDKVLNNGTAVNELKLRITSLVKPDPLKPDEGTIVLNPDLGPTKPPATKFTFSFESSPRVEPPTKYPWALAFVDEVANIKIADHVLFKIDQATQTDSPVWTITPNAQISISPGKSIELKFRPIKTDHPSGLTNLYIKYKNIPGYWDGNFVAVIEKAPVIYKDQLVGIGRNDPSERLHVAGDLRVDGKVTSADLRVEKDVSVGSGGVFQVDAPNVRGGRLNIDSDGKVSVKQLRVEKLMSLGGDAIVAIDATNVNSGRVKIEADGRVGIGTNDPQTHLHVKGVANQEIMIESSDEGGVKWSLQSSSGARNGRFEIVNRSPGSNCFTILKSGNIGIGTVTPGECINTGDYFKPDKNGRMLEIHSPGNEAWLNFSSSQNSDGAHIGGIYFTRTERSVQDDAHRQIAAIKCKQRGQGTMGGGELQFFTKLLGGGADLNHPAMVVREDGRVGIGTTDPQAMLQIRGWMDSEIPSYQYMNRNRPGVHIEGVTAKRDLSIHAERRVAASEFNAFSDARIKSIHGRSDGAADLATLLGIEITDYSFKDVIGKGVGAYKKVIGQQVDKVFPQAVSRQTDVVPDIYQSASIHEGWVALATDLKKGERVRLITEKGEHIHEVLEVTDEKFRVDLDRGEDKVFVFGREVDDFLTVDYDAISMLNVSATQQLKKEMDEQLRALRVENAELRAANDALAKRLQLLESRLETALGVTAAAGGSNGNGRH